jgi:hypothetical protein
MEPVIATPGDRHRERGRNQVLRGEDSKTPELVLHVWRKCRRHTVANTVVYRLCRQTVKRARSSLALEFQNEQ